MDDARKTKEALLKAEAAKWRAAHARRTRWTDADFDEEASRLEDEIAKLVAAGSVTRGPTVWATGASGKSIFTDS